MYRSVLFASALSCFVSQIWWVWQDLNLWPHAYQACALTNWATGPSRRAHGNLKWSLHTGQRPSPVASTQAEQRVEDPLIHEHKPKVYILFEERETWTATLAIPIRLPKQFRGVLRFDGRLTGAIYCSKKHGKVHTILDGRLTVPQLP